MVSFYSGETTDFVQLACKCTHSSADALGRSVFRNKLAFRVLRAI